MAGSAVRPPVEEENDLYFWDCANNSRWSFVDEEIANLVCIFELSFYNILTQTLQIWLIIALQIWWGYYIKATLEELVTCGHLDNVSIYVYVARVF